MTNVEESSKEKTQLAQFKRDLSHILIITSPEVQGPEITVGQYTLNFKSKAPVSALAELIGNDNRIEAMRQYVLLCLVEESQEAFGELLGKVDVEGLGEIINALGEGYTSFQDPS